MMVTIMRMMEVATTTLIITIVGSEEGAAISVIFSNIFIPVMVSFIIVIFNVFAVV